MATPVAFFDVDGTLFRSSLLIELVEALAIAEIFPVGVRAEYEREYEAWRNREGSYEAYIGAVIDTFLNHIKGVHYSTFADIGKGVAHQHRKHVYRYTRDLIHSLKKEGYFLVAISQSPKTLLDVFCQDYGFDKVYGRVYELGPQDRFTGEVIDEHLIENKANIVERVFDKHPTLSRERSVAVGDTDGDIPLLQTVARPICFNPNATLYAHARKLQWSIVVERKDVIYEIAQ